jgi:hypothetical protein
VGKKRRKITIRRNWWLPPYILYRQHPKTKEGRTRRHWSSQEAQD